MKVRVQNRPATLQLFPNEKLLLTPDTIPSNDNDATVPILTVYFAHITALWKRKLQQRDNNNTVAALRLQVEQSTSTDHPTTSGSSSSKTFVVIQFEQESDQETVAAVIETFQQQQKTAASSPVSAAVNNNINTVVKKEGHGDVAAVKKENEGALKSSSSTVPKSAATAIRRGARDEHNVDDEEDDNEVEDRKVHGPSALLFGALVEEGLLSVSELTTFLQSDPNAPLHGTHIAFDAIEQLIDPATLSLRPLLPQLVQDVFTQLPMLAKLYEKTVLSEADERPFWDAVVKRYLLFERSMLDEGMLQLLHEEPQTTNEKSDGTATTVKSTTTTNKNEATSLLESLNKASAHALPIHNKKNHKGAQNRRKRTRDDGEVHIEEDSDMDEELFDFGAAEMEEDATANRSGVSLSNGVVQQQKRTKVTRWISATPSAHHNNIAPPFIDTTTSSTSFLTQLATAPEVVLRLSKEEQHPQALAALKNFWSLHPNTVQHQLERSIFSARDSERQQQQRKKNRLLSVEEQQRLEKAKVSLDRLVTVADGNGNSVLSEEKVLGRCVRWALLAQQQQQQ